MKKLLAILLALASLMAMLAIPAAAGAVPQYKYTLPENYSATKEYPVVYLLPTDGLASHNETLYDAIRAGGTDMIIIRPTFTAGMDLHAEMAALVAKVDSEYRTIADKNYRAIVGAQVGGYLAYALGMTNGTAYKNPADLFTFVASVDGDFAYNDYAYGNILSMIKDGLKSYDEQKAYLDQMYGDYAQYFYPPNPLESYYTYMDAPVESKYADETGSTNDLGSFYIDQGVGSNLHEYTARAGKYDVEFLKESGKRIAANFTSWMLSDVATGKVSLAEPTLTADQKNAKANYTVTISDEIAAFTTGGVPMKITISVEDPESGEVLTSASVTRTVNGAGDYSGNLTIGNKVSGSFSNVKLSVQLLGTELDLGTAFLVRSSKPVVNGDYQKIDLMGDWYFNYIGTAAPLNVSEVTKNKEYKSWSIAQPGLGNWADGHGNINSETVGTPSTSPYFGYMIIGGGYYAKEFDLPAGFNAQDVMLSIGYIDDRCEVFLNGKRVGATGMDDKGEPTGESTWAAYSCFEIDPSLLNYGGTNTVIVRAWNDTSLGAGGWYSGPIALYSKKAFDAENDQSSGFVEETYYSAALGKDMEYMIYLPKGYENSDRYYPTMYLLHQFNSDHTSYRADGIDVLMDELIAEGRIDEMIVVVPNSSVMSFWRDSYEKMVIEDLIPHIDANYRTVADARYRMTVGCSMGGQGAMAVALRNPNYFSGVVSFYGAFDYGYDTDPRLIATTESAEYLDRYAIYFICGNQDSYGFGSCNIDLHKILLSKGVDHEFFIENGEHSGTFYLPNFKDAIEYAYKNLPRVDNETVKKAATGTIEASVKDGKVILTPTFGLNSSFASAFDAVPGSGSYTDDQTPAQNIPLIITLEQDGKTEDIIVRDNDVEPVLSRSITVTMSELADLDVTELIDPTKPFTIIYKAALFDYEPIVLSTVQVGALMADPNALPDTGDHSSMLVWGLALVASAALLVMNSKKRRAA